MFAAEECRTTPAPGGTSKSAAFTVVLKNKRVVLLKENTYRVQNNFLKIAFLLQVGFDFLM